MTVVNEILLVEDDRDFSESLKLLLEMKNFSVVVVGSGEEAVDVYSSRSFSCVLMDIKLPGISGLEALEQIQEINSDARILLMTGCERGSDEVASAQMAKTIGVLYKPFRIKELLTIICN